MATTQPGKQANLAEEEQEEEREEEEEGEEEKEEEGKGRRERVPCASFSASFPPSSHAFVLKSV